MLKLQPAPSSPTPFFSGRPPSRQGKAWDYLTSLQKQLLEEKKLDTFMLYPTDAVQEITTQETPQTEIINLRRQLRKFAPELGIHVASKSETSQKIGKGKQSSTISASILEWLTAVKKNLGKKFETYVLYPGKAADKLTQLLNIDKEDKDKRKLVIQYIHRHAKTLEFKLPSKSEAIQESYATTARTKTLSERMKTIWQNPTHHQKMSSAAKNRKHTQVESEN